MGKVFLKKKKGKEVRKLKKGWKKGREKKKGGKR